MTGYVRSKGYNFSGNQIAKSLRRVNPTDHARRTADIVRRQNPVPYQALYHGHKLHCDQNEKLVMYGCILYALNGGHSSKVIRLFGMPKKNAMVIYSHFRYIEMIYLLVRINYNLSADLSFECVKKGRQLKRE